MEKYININGRKVGKGERAYIIAEMSANHAKDINRAKEIIRKAKESGADCIKIQTYTPDTLTIDCDNRYFRVENGTWEGENLYSLYEKAYTPWEWQLELKEEADRVGIDFFSTPFDESAVDFLEKIGCTFYKIASFEMIHLPLLKYIAKTGKPIIMSTGMSSDEEIKEALETIFNEGNENVILLNCTSAYPAKASDMNLRTIPYMQERYGVSIGLSDHSLGSDAAVTSVILGGCVVEKHFCISRDIDNPDASFSMTPDEFREMVDRIRSHEDMLGTPMLGVSSQEESSIVFRRSIFATKDIKAGEVFTKDNIRIIRPGYGLKPKYYEDVIGKIADCDIEFGEPIKLSHLGEGKVLFLTNNDNAMPLYDWLVSEGEDIITISNKISIEQIEELNPKFVISFNYRHIISKEIVDYMGGKIINIHTSYLPYNRGSKPNFFSFYEDTKKGVTIHLLDKGLDTGDILVQKEYFFDEEKETFKTTYQALTDGAIELFKENWADIKSENIIATKQSADATKHTLKEYNEIVDRVPYNYDEIIADVRKRWL